MFQRRFGIKSASRYAWIVPAVVVLALVLIYFFGNGGGESSRKVATLERTDAVEVFQVGTPDEYRDLRAEESLSARQREAVLQNLSELRAEYKLVSPKVTSFAANSSSGGGILARTIGGLLANYGLGQFSAVPTSPLTQASPGADVVVYAAAKDAVIARSLVAALAPLMAGRVAIVFDDRLKTGNLRLVVVSEPAFTDEGVAVFQ